MQVNISIDINEYYNENCLENFLEDPKFECLQIIQEKMKEIPEDIRYDEKRDGFNTEIYKIIKDKIPE